MKNVTIFDSTLRDGNHAVKHQITKEQIGKYCLAADKAGVPVVIVGHGNGLSASSLQVGECLLDDETIITTARNNLINSKLAIFSIPGFCTVSSLQRALNLGVDLVCVASHCTEANVTQKYIETVALSGKEVYGVLMMSHMVDKNRLLEEALKMQSYGAQGIVLMDSAGAYLPLDVTEKVSYLVSKLSVPVGFHAHNNLGVGVANSIAAVQAGATIVDCCTRGFGAGAGNAQLEVIVAILQKLSYTTGINLYDILDASEMVGEIMTKEQVIKPINIISGLAGVFSGFEKHVQRISQEYGVDPRDLFMELGKNNAVAGQENLIIELAIELSTRGLSTKK